MEYFGFSLLFSCGGDVDMVRQHVQENLDELVTPDLYICHLHKDNFVDESSPI